MIQHLLKLTDCLFCHLKELLEKIISLNIIDILFHIIVPKIPIKDFNGLISGKGFFELLVKNKKAYKKVIHMSRINDYTTGNLLDFACFKKHYRLIAIDLSKQSKLKDPKQINFIGQLENQAHGAKMFFLIENSEETTFKFSQNLVNIL